MATTLNKEILDYYEWGSYPYQTWGGVDSVTWGDAGKRLYSLLDTNEITASDSKSIIFGGRYNEKISLNDFLRQALDITRIDNINIAETYWDNIFFNLNIGENISVKAGIYEDFTWGNYIAKTWGANKGYSWNVSNLKAEFQYAMVVLHKDNIKVVDTYHSTIAPNKLETIKVTEEHKRIAQYGRTLTEAISVVTEDYLKAIGKSLSERVWLNDTVTKESLKNVSQDILLSETLSHKGKFGREYNETLNVNDALSRQYSKMTYDAIAIRDTYLESAEGVISNLYITEGETSLEEFNASINIAPGYTEFVEFKVGEYEYQDALVRIVMQGGNMTQPTASGVTMHVDIPDTDDRGTATITDASNVTKVYLNKSYYTTPEVQVTLKNGNTASGFITPNIVSVDGQDEYGRYFEVELLTSSGTRTTGTISWVAKGY